MKIAISSMSILDSLGESIEDNFNLMLQGKTGQKSFETDSGIRTGFPFDPELVQKIEESTEIENSNNGKINHVKVWQKLAYHTAAKAITAARLETKKVSILTGSCFGGQHLMPYHLDIIKRKGRPHPRYLLETAAHGIGSLINQKYQFEHGTAIYNSACATGLYVIEQACNQLYLKKSQACVIVGIDLVCNQPVLEFFDSMGAMSKSGQCRPYHNLRDGFLAGDGIGCMVIEPLESALSRGIKPIAIIDQVETASESFNLVAPDPSGFGIHSVMGRLKDTLKGHSIDLISTHATGTPVGDFIELDTLSTYTDAAVTAFKGFIGHTQGAAGIIETIYAIAAMNHNLIPGLPWLRDTEIYNQQIHTETQNQEINRLLKLSIGFGGMVCGAVISKYHD